jgi:hypothetical protein
MSFAGFGVPPPDVRHRRRALPWILAGGLSILAVVVFFWSFAVRDAATLEHGDRTTGTVVGLVQASDWDPMDSGRLVVRYEIYGEMRQSSIWLDNDISEYAVGQQVPVFVRGDHVRTDRENNDPAPLGTVAILVGLGGIAALIRGWVVRSPKQEMTVAGDVTVLPLSSWPFGRRPAIELTASGEVRIRAPGFFGSRRLVVPATHVAVEEQLDPFALEDPDDTIFFEKPLLLLDLPTRTRSAVPNLILGFASPVRVPPLRAILAFESPFPFTWRASRSAEGVYADGVLLRSPLPEQATAALVSSGATRVPELVTWLAGHRQVATDPVRIAQLRAADERFARGVRYGLWAWYAAAGLLIVAKVTETWWALALAFASMAVGFVLEKRTTASAER